MRRSPLELAHELADLAELAGHRDELLVDQRLLAVELGGGAATLLVEQRAVRLEQPVQQRLADAALLVGEVAQLQCEVGGRYRRDGAVDACSAGGEQRRTEDGTGDDRDEDGDENRSELHGGDHRRPGETATRAGGGTATEGTAS